MHYSNNLNFKHIAHRLDFARLNPNLPKPSAYFKGENGVVNIGLGNGKALKSFSKNISSFKIVNKVLP